MKINKLHPWLPQSTPEPFHLHGNLDKQIRNAKLRATHARKDRIAASKKYNALLQKRRGPFSREMIEAAARSHRARRESTSANEELRRLLAMKKSEAK